MSLTPAQVKGRIKSIAAKSNADARLLMRIYMMDRFLERLASSPYRDNFIIKGGILITSMVGVAMRSTMDIDASIKNLNLNAKDVEKAVKEIVNISLDDGIGFEVKRVSNIMDNFEYPGIRLELQTILARDVFNTRMRDFYDIFTLMKLYINDIDDQVLGKAFIATSQKRNSTFDHIGYQLENIAKSTELQKLWEQYQDKYTYADGVSFESVMDSVKVLAQKAGII